MIGRENTCSYTFLCRSTAMDSDGHIFLHSDYKQNSELNESVCKYDTHHNIFGSVACSFELLNNDVPLDMVWMEPETDPRHVHIWIMHRVLVNNLR